MAFAQIESVLFKITIYKVFSSIMKVFKLHRDCGMAIGQVS